MIRVLDDDIIIPLKVWYGTGTTRIYDMYDKGIMMNWQWTNYVFIIYVLIVTFDHYFLAFF